MTTRIAINGFGRIGRVITRLLLQQQKDWNLDLVAINDLASPQTLAHLLKYDSVHGKAKFSIQPHEQHLELSSKKVPVLNEKDPSKLPWKELAVDVVLECTGIFRSKEKASTHLKAGASKVLISAPSPDPDITIALGVNETNYKNSEHHVVSCASCTTNCLAPLAKVIDEAFGIVKGSMTTIHSYTNDQQILDLPHSDLRRARAAAISMIPTSTGAAQALGLVLPHLKGKVDGFSVRVPTSDVSLVDFVCEVSKPTTVEQLNKALKEAAEGALKGILGYSEEPLVSIDYVGSTLSSCVDSLSNMVIDGNLVKAVAWYDNESGFSSRMLDVAELIAK